MSSSVRTFIGNLSAVLLMFLCIFLSAGRLAYWQGWVFFALYLLVPLFTFLYVPGEVMREWRKPGPGAKAWDKLLLAVMTPITFAVPIVSGLDAGRFGWTGALPAAVYVVIAKKSKTPEGSQDQPKQ